MNVEHDPEQHAARIAAALGETARSRMLYSLMNGAARTATELALVAEVSPSTASVHLNRLQSEELVRVVAQGKHRYYTLHNERVADLLETLSVLAGRPHGDVVPRAPAHLRAARTCYDHLAGTLGVALHDRLLTLGWLAQDSSRQEGAYEVTATGANALESLGIDLDETRGLRRRFAFACLDWSERRPHIGGAIGAALLRVFLRKRWVSPHPTSRALRVTAIGRRELAVHFDIRAP